MTKKQYMKNCGACTKVSDGSLPNQSDKHLGNWYCKHHKKYLKDIDVCNIEKYKRPECPICLDIIEYDGEKVECICKGNPDWRKK
jgi:hypothetical protein